MSGQREDHRLLELIHLDEEELALLAGGRAAEPEAAAHLDACACCAERLELAQTVLRVQPLHAQADPRRRDALLRRLAQEGAFAPGPGEGAWLRLALDADAIRVLQTNTEVRISRAVATRGAELHAPPEAPGAVAFFRRMGSVSVEVQLVRAAQGRFHLMVGLSEGEPAAGWRVALHRGPRELASEPAPGGSATFKNLRPDAYRLVVLDGIVPVGMVDVDVESR